MITVHLSLEMFIEWVWFYFLRRGFDCQTNCWKITSLIIGPIGSAFKVWCASCKGKVKLLLEKYKEVDNIVSHGIS